MWGFPGALSSLSTPLFRLGFPPNLTQVGSIELDQGWDYMQKGITKLKRILAGLPEAPFKPEEGVMLYTTVYNMCTQKRYDYSQQLYDKYREAIEEYIETTVMPSLREKPDENTLLKELVRRWKNYKIMVRWLSRFFNYLDRFFIRRRSLPALNEVGLSCFRDLFYREETKQARAAVIGLIDKEGKGEQIDRALLENLRGLFVEIGMGPLENLRDIFVEIGVGPMDASESGCNGSTRSAGVTNHNWSSQIATIGPLDCPLFLIGIGLEVSSVVFDLLSSPEKPRYALVGMLCAIVAVVLSILELIYASQNTARSLIMMLPEITGFGLATFQSISSVVQFYSRHEHNQLNIYLGGVYVCFCLFLFKLFGRKSRNH